MYDIKKALVDCSTNVRSCDGFPCTYCGEEIEVHYKDNGEVDRSNRIDTDLSTGDCPKAYYRSYHLKCWKKALWD